MANSASYRKTITGLDGISKILRGLPETMQTLILADGVEAAAKPIERAAKRLVPVRTGALRMSIGHKVVRGKNAPFAMALIGPDRGSYRGGQRIAKGSDSRGADKPVNYAHLVEFGHIAVKPRKGTSLRKKSAQTVGFVPARPFLRPAVIAAEVESINALAQGISSGIEKARVRLKS